MSDLSSYLTNRIKSQGSTLMTLSNPNPVPMTPSLDSVLGLSFNPLDPTNTLL